MTNASNRRTREILVLLSLLQGMAGILLAASPFLAWHWTQSYAARITAIALLPAVAFCACFGVVLVTCIRLWQRLKTERAFILKNAQALARIAVGCCLCAGVILLGPFCFGPWRQTLTDLFLVFAFAGVGVFSFALEQLCRRAIVIQDENDTTV